MVNDIYDNVQRSREEIEQQTKAELLYDYAEFVNFFNKWCCRSQLKEPEMGFLYVLEIQESENYEENWTGKVNAISQVINRVGSDVKNGLDVAQTNCVDYAKGLGRDVDGLHKKAKDVKRLFIELT